MKLPNRVGTDDGILFKIYEVRHFGGVHNPVIPKKKREDWL